MWRKWRKRCEESEECDVCHISFFTFFTSLSSLYTSQHLLIPQDSWMTYVRVAYAQAKEVCTHNLPILIPSFKRSCKCQDNEHPARFSFQDIRHHQTLQCIKRSNHWHCVVKMWRVASVHCRNLLHHAPEVCHAEPTKFYAAQETPWSGLSTKVFRQLPYHQADNLSCSRQWTMRMATAISHQSKCCSISGINTWSL